MKRPPLRPLEIVTRQHTFAKGAAAKGTLPVHVLGLTRRGRVRYRSGEQQMEAGAGAVTLVSPHAPQHWEVVQAPWDVVYCTFQAPGDWVELLRYPRQMPGHALLEPGRRWQRPIRQCLEEMVRVCELALTHRAELQYALLQQALWWCRTALEEAGPQPLDDRVRLAIEHMTQQMATPLQLPAVASRVGLSRARFAGVFRQQVGQAPMAWLETQRLARAAQLLRMTQEPVAVVAEAVGFEDSRYFARRFKQATGQSPRGYRRSQQASRG